MIKFSCTFSCAGSSFGETDAERIAAIAAVLREIASEMEINGQFSNRVRDANGNIIGQYHV